MMKTSFFIVLAPHLWGTIPNTLNPLSLSTENLSATCPLGMKIDVGSSLFMRSERLFTTSMGERLAYCLHLNPRCIHCVLERLRNEPYWEQSKSDICIIPNCSQLSWNGVGLFCDQHYQLFVTNWEMVKKERRPAIPIPPHLQDIPAALRTLQENTFTLQPCRLQTIVHALQLAIVIQLISQLTQPKEERQLPWFLFQGFRELIFDRNLRRQGRKIEVYIWIKDTW